MIHLALTPPNHAILYPMIVYHTFSSGIEHLSRSRGARLRGRKATQRSKKGFEKVLGTVLGKLRGPNWGLLLYQRVPH